MAKALLGHMSSDLRYTARQTVERLMAENRRLRELVAELEARVDRLSVENEELTTAQAAVLLEPIEDMQPA
ncbi:hypothetical protein [Nocardioides daejeonensis]|uniref:hypothetical protein n=1 Tax=Nocardioides daejeonensis TaxID=1046556 RepID=UPI000D7410E6|nr:hypothetical protein [Nocardioides daejeonensis]